MCVGRLLPSQIMCAGNGPLLCVGPFISARRYTYLRELLDRYGSPGFLAAYNAKPARYEDHLATGRALPAETQAYVTSLTPMIVGGTIDDATVVNAVVRSWTEAPLFVVSNESTTAKSPESSNLRSGQRSTDSPAQDWTGLAAQSPGLFIGISHGNRQP
jgi:hypothetical protein